MFNEYLAHELAKERMYDAIRQAQRARRRTPARHSKDAGLWSTFWRTMAHRWQAFGSLAEGMVALKRR
jgi:hypothetical protein